MEDGTDDAAEWMPMDKDLAEELGTQETCSLEFKREARDRDPIRKAICALANDLNGIGGGDLLIGVDKHGAPYGSVDTSDEALLKLIECRNEGKILDRPSMTVTVESYRHSPVIRIHVHAASAPPVRLDGVAYVRPGPQTTKATSDDERVLIERRRANSATRDLHAVPGTGVDDLDLSLFRGTYLPSAVDLAVIEENHRPERQQLASLKLLAATGCATVLGLVLIGLSPTAHVPGAYVQFVRYDGADVNAPVADEQELTANIIDTAGQLESTLRGHNHTRLVDDGGFREREVSDYPFPALREACMNALMHRNYESSNAPVRIQWFDDRVEVSNPGGPYGQVRPDNYDRVNDYRNPSLAAAMKHLGYVNRFGRGIGRIRAAMSENGNPAPEFDIDDSAWVVVLRRSRA
ncbi:ATP-binding protein [Streptomonospora wellingtoniae]|uniref:ATP-binding protein n=1 Tax=Streptomonospora wellingtoniae TaxID=3075544 RepID=A0ABU2KZV6_9ACTN|nr:ATP-binding protein [Streptomonospora sp. DSM 45055]MDT0304847.1 ATP-binding protein [Streptomonospora sp. DSM 45055]